MIPIFVVSNSGYTGKTLLALGLALRLTEKGYRVGYIKPIGRTPVKKGSDVYDADAVFIKEVLALPDPLSVISPFVFSYETQHLLFEGRLGDIRKKVVDTVASQKDKDFVLIGGACDLFEGAVLNINATDLLEKLDGRALMVEVWKGDASMDTLVGGSRLMGKRFAGAVINKVPVSSLALVKEHVKPFLEKNGVRIFGVLPKDSILESITVRQLIEILNGRVLCCEERLDEFVEHFSIGAMDVDSALGYFRRIPNKAVITGAHRSDIQLAAMETSTRCIILTGGFYTNDVVLGKAQSKGIPIISVADDTFTTIEKIESVMGKTRIREKGKIDRAKELIDASFDMEEFLSTVRDGK